MGARNQRGTFDAHRRAYVARKRRDVLDLYLAHPGWTYRDLGQAMGLSASHVSKLVAEALRRAAADEQDLAQVALARSLKLYQLQMEAAWEIVRLPCGKCAGSGTEQKLDEHQQAMSTFNNDGVIVPVLTVCSLCEHGSGYAYPYQARLAAIDRHAKALEQMNKLLGLYEPDTINLNVNFRADLASLPEDQLARMLDEYADGYTSAAQQPALAPAPQQEEVA